MFILFGENPPVVLHFTQRKSQRPYNSLQFLCDHVTNSDYTVHWILQARITEWVGSLSLLQRIFPTRGSNPVLPLCRWVIYQLSHQGSLKLWKLNSLLDFLFFIQFQATACWRGPNKAVWQQACNEIRSLIFSLIMKEKHIVSIIQKCWRSLDILTIYKWQYICNACARLQIGQ